MMLHSKKLPTPLLHGYQRLIAAVLTAVLAIAGIASAPHATAKPPSPADIARCEAETAAYNAAWANGWAATNNKPASQAPPPPVPYKCGPVPDDPVADDTPAIPNKPDAPAINIPQLPDRDKAPRPTAEPGKPGGGITRPSENKTPLNNKDGSPKINPKEGNNSDEDKEGIDRRPPLDEATLNRVASALERLLDDPENVADNAPKELEDLDTDLEAQRELQCSGRFPSAYELKDPKDPNSGYKRKKMTEEQKELYNKLDSMRPNQTQKDRLLDEVRRGEHGEFYQRFQQLQDDFNIDVDATEKEAKDATERITKIRAMAPEELKKYFGGDDVPFDASKLFNAVRDSANTIKIDADHKISLRRFVEYPGFDELPEETQRKIINDSRNLQPLLHRENSSKTDKGMDEWRGVKDYLMSQEEWEERCKEEQRVAEETAKKIDHEVARERERIRREREERERREREAEAYRQYLAYLEYQQWVAQVEAENAAAAAAQAPPKGGRKPSPKAPNSKPQPDNPKPRSNSKPPKDDSGNSNKPGPRICYGPCQWVKEHPETAVDIALTGAAIAAAPATGGGTLVANGARIGARAVAREVVRETVNA